MFVRNRTNKTLINIRRYLGYVWMSQFCRFCSDSSMLRTVSYWRIKFKYYVRKGRTDGLRNSRWSAEIWNFILFSIKISSCIPVYLAYISISLQHALRRAAPRGTAPHRNATVWKNLRRSIIAFRPMVRRCDAMFGRIARRSTKTPAH